MDASGDPLACGHDLGKRDDVVGGFGHARSMACADPAVIGLTCVFAQAMIS